MSTQSECTCSADQTRNRVPEEIDVSGLAGLLGHSVLVGNAIGRPPQEGVTPSFVTFGNPDP